MEAGLFHADRQTDMPKLIITFRNFANAPKESIINNTKASSRAIFKLRQSEFCPLHTTRPTYLNTELLKLTWNKSEMYSGV